MSYYEEKNDESSHQVVDINDLVSSVARHNVAAKAMPVHAGNSYLYDVPQGWEQNVLLQDNDIKLVRNTRDMDECYEDQNVKAILIPKESAITREAAIAVCSGKPQAMTVFFEVDDHGEK